MFRFTNVLAAFAFTVGVASGAQAASYSFSTSQSQFDAGVNNQGWWSSNLVDIDTNQNQNVLAGNVRGFLFRNFFTFDLSSLSLAANEKIVGATLSGPAAGISVFGGAFETFGLFDVSTDAATLNFNVGNDLDIFEDLGTGDSYGTRNFFVSDAGLDMSMDLNQNAFEDLIAAQGGYFSLGGALLTIDDLGEQEFVFAGRSRDNPFTLDIETQISAVPLPAAFPLYGAGLAVMGFIGWRKRKKAAA